MFCHMDKKMISLPFEWCIGNYPGLFTIVYQNNQMLPYVHGLSNSYLYFCET